MKTRYDFDEYLKNGYPLVSLGQLMIKKESIPKVWIEKTMICNGWDDHYLWAAMMVNGVTVATNNDVLYIHEEDGDNFSFNWKQMAKSGEEFKEIFIANQLLDIEQKKKFFELVNAKINKYKEYDTLQFLMNKCTAKNIENLLLSKGINLIAIYGIGIFGKKLLEILNDTQINVLYGIDRNNVEKKEEFPIYSISKKNIFVDAIIVTPVEQFEKIKKEIEPIYNCKIISLMELLIEVDDGKCC